MTNNVGKIYLWNSKRLLKNCKKNFSGIHLGLTLCISLDIFRTVRHMDCTDQNLINRLIKLNIVTEHTCSRYLDWILPRASHILQGFWPAGSKTSWFTITECVSMLHFVSSCTSRSVSNSDRNSAMHTHINVVISYTNHTQTRTCASHTQCPL